jgi:hypothetical protein
MSNVHHCLLSACCKHSQICYVNGFAAHTKWLAPPMGRCSSRNFLSWAKPDHKVSQFFCVETSNVDKPCRQILYFSTLTCSLFAPPLFHSCNRSGVLCLHFCRSFDGTLLRGSVDLVSWCYSFCPLFERNQQNN